MTRDMALQQFQHALDEIGISSPATIEKNGWVSYLVERPCGLNVSVLFTGLALSVGVYSDKWDSVSFMSINFRDISRLHTGESTDGRVYISLAGTFMSVDLGGE